MSKIKNVTSEAAAICLVHVQSASRAIENNKKMQRRLLTADKALVSGSNPADFNAANGSSVTIKNSVPDANGTEVATPLSCDSGLFTPANDYPTAMTAGQEITVQIGASGKGYCYVDPALPGQGTRTGRMDP